ATVPGLGTSFGRGGATTFQQDLANADAILIMGSNMAENHPVGFRWPMKARERGATIIHVEYIDAEDNGGVFSGYDPRSGTYDNASWAYAAPPQGATRDETLQHPR